jgi:hypothetical protein
MRRGRGEVTSPLSNYTKFDIPPISVGKGMFPALRVREARKFEREIP